MRALMIDETETDLADQSAPFLSNYTVVAMNVSGASVTLQEADESGGTFTTLAVVADGVAAEVTLAKQIIKLSAAGSLVLLGN